jgi:hypothetical protein
MATRTRRLAVPNDDIEDEMDTTEENEERSVSSRLSGPISDGWGAPKKQLRKTVKAPYLDIKLGKRIIKIHDVKPFAQFGQHYVNSANTYYTCGKEWDDDGALIVRCPLCDKGHYGSRQFRLNVTDMEKRAEVKTWTFGITVSKILENFAKEKKTSPLNRDDMYYHVWRTKPDDGGAWTYTILPLKARDLEEDEQVKPLTEDELATQMEELYNSDTVWIHSMDQLQLAADKLTEKDLKRN